VKQRQETQIKHHDSKPCKARSFQPGENTLVLNLRSNNPKWITGKIVKRLGPLSYLVQIGGINCKRHVDQLMPLKQQQLKIPSNQTEEDFFMPTPSRTISPQPQNNKSIRQNPPRIRKPPDRLTY